MNMTAPFDSVHLAAVRAAQKGDNLSAARLFAAAPDEAQIDPRFLTDYALFASAMGKHGLAASLYGRAIGATPGEVPHLRLRQALAAMDAGFLIDAIGLLQALTHDHPDDATAWQALGAAHQTADRPLDAMTAFDRALALVPADPLARLSRAQMLDELGEPAIAAFDAAMAVAPDSARARLALAAAQASVGNPAAARTTLLARLARAPAWAEGWAALASLTHRWEGRAASLATIDAALAAAPRDTIVTTTMLRSMAALDANHAVLAKLPAARSLLSHSPPLTLIEAQAASEIGDVARADAAFTRLAGVDDPVVLLARLRHALRAGRPDDAVAIGQPMMMGEAARFALPYLGAAWRLLSDPRHDWLEGDPRLVGAYDLGIDRGDVMAVAAELRTLHTTRHPPFEQSMRGGTQTEGVLLSRQSPAIRLLRASLERAIRKHIDGLPPVDVMHPTLSVPRGPFRFSGSWSVRLSGGGLHANHVHSDGWLSSACYIALSDAMMNAAADDEAGWLTLGQPPVELGLGLGPLQTIRPVEGQVVLFPSIMWHGTLPAPIGERLTVAFDVQPLV